MKKILIALFFVNSAFSAVLLERELYNARNGETHVCRIHDDGTTEIINEGVSAGRSETIFGSKDSNVMGWLEELKAVSSAKGAKMDIKEITQYVHQGLKVYSFYKGSEKFEYYRLAKLKVASGSKKTGSVEHKISNDKGNVQRLRGQTDLACKNAISKI